MIHKLVLVACAVLFLAVLPSNATPVCSATGSYADLQAVGSCEINDLVFSNFTFTPSATGTGLIPLATQMAYTLDDPGTSTGTGQSIWGFEFNPNLSVLGVGSEDISIQYDITAPVAEITSIHLLETAVIVGSAIATVGETDCGKLTSAGGCTFLPTMSVSPASPHQDILGIGPYLSLHIIKDMNVTSTAAGSFASISDVRDAVDEINNGASVPEPASLQSLLAGGMLLIGLGARKRSLGR